MAAASKVETHVRDGTPSSIESTPDRDGAPEVSQEQPAQPVKRKGGRKPERKQRNRQAQAAFRERRTEYIKQLEAQIKQNEDSLATLQQSHRSAADECLMLRYKNSLLERILLEKGIDVQAELQMKTGSPILGHGFMPPGTNMQQPQAAQAPLQRAAIQRQHARKSGVQSQGYLPKLAPGQTQPEMGYPQPSPQGHPTPSSHASSPNSAPTRSPLTMHQGGMTPPSSTVLAQGQAQQYHAYPRSSQQPSNTGFYQPQQPNLQRTMQRPLPPSHYHSSASAVSSHSTTSQHSLNPPMSAGATNVGPASAGGPSSAAAYYPSPFQKHIDQLEQEYDTQQSRSMLDQPPDQQDNAATEHDGSADPSPTQLQGNYPPQFGMGQTQQLSGQEYYQQSHGQTQMLPPEQQQQFSHKSRATRTSQPQPSSNTGGPFAYGQPIDPNDPMLDADPFGLSASMHYPTSYSVMEQQPPRR